MESKLIDRETQTLFIAANSEDADDMLTLSLQAKSIEEIRNNREIIDSADAIVLAYRNSEELAELERLLSMHSKTASQLKLAEGGVLGWQTEQPEFQEFDLEEFERGTSSPIVRELQKRFLQEHLLQDYQDEQFSDENDASSGNDPEVTEQELAFSPDNSCDSAAKDAESPSSGQPSLPDPSEEEQIKLKLLALVKTAPSQLQFDLAISSIAKEHAVGVKVLKTTYAEIEEQYESEQARKTELTDEERAAKAAEDEAERLRQEAAEKRKKLVEARAQNIAQSPDIPASFQKTMRKHLKYVVGTRGATTICITQSARLLRTSMGFILSGLSGSGKSGLAEKAAQLMPPELVVRYTSWSNQALSYAGDLTNKLILCGEIKPYKPGEDDEAQQQMRQLISENVITRAVVEKGEDGQQTLVVHETRGPASVVMTTTREQSSFNDEFVNRQSFLYMNDSTEVTEEVLYLQAKDAACVPDAGSEDETQVEIEAWQEYHRSLKPMRVVIPFAAQIVPGPRDVTVRRLFPLLLNYIRALALLHQHSRNVVENNGHPYIVATLNDYAVAYEVVLANAPRVLDTVSKQGRKIYDKLQEHFLKEQFTRAQAQVLLKLAMSTVKRYFYELEGAGCLTCDGKKGSANLYRIEKEPAASQELGLVHPSKVICPSDHIGEPVGEPAATQVE